MRVIALTNQKGGSGKTSTTVNLAGGLALLGKKSLIIDLDAQRHSTRWLNKEVSDEDDKPNLMHILKGQGSLESLVCDTQLPEVQIVPGTRWLTYAQTELAGRVMAELNLRKKIGELTPEKWDYVLLDCPPGLGPVLIQALVAATEFIITVDVSSLGADGVVQLLDTVTEIKQVANPGLVLSGVLPCRARLGTVDATDLLAELKDYFKHLVMEPIRDSVAVRRCVRYSLPVTHFDAKSPGAKDYTAFAKAVDSVRRSDHVTA